MAQDRKVYSLSQLNQSLENHFTTKFGDRIFWVTAEVIKVNAKNGNFYLELADSKNSIMTAKSSATLWSRNYRVVQDQVGATELQGILKPGNNVLFALKITYHPVYGLKLNILDIDPAYSYGAIEKRRREVIEKLRIAQLLDKQKSLKLPAIIKRIALIGSPDTSGFTDFNDELFNNHAFNKFVIEVFPVRVQGEQAVPELISAVKEAGRYDADVIVILRGGGSKMDLAIFDDFDLANTIANSRLPVLTGIGHETDRVVADLVAHSFFKTPTAVAAYIHYAIASYKEIMGDLYDRIIHRAQRLISVEREEFNHVNRYLQHHSGTMIQYWRTQFQQFENEVITAATSIVHASKRTQDSIIHQLIYQGERTVQSHQNELDRMLEDVKVNAIHLLDQERKFSMDQRIDQIRSHSINQLERYAVVLENYNDLLDMLNPHKMLMEGYTISTIEGTDVQDVAGALTGQTLKTLTSKQLITSEIKAVKNTTEKDGNQR